MALSGAGLAAQLDILNFLNLFPHTFSAVFRMPGVELSGHSNRFVTAFFSVALPFPPENHAHTGNLQLLLLPFLQPQSAFAPVLVTDLHSAPCSSYISMFCFCSSVCSSSSCSCC